MHKKQFTFFSFGAALFVAIILFGISQTGIGGGVAGILRWVFTPFQISLFHGQQLISSHQNPLEKLQIENNQLKIALAKQKELENENQALHDQFHSTELYSQKLLPATIVSMPGFIPTVTAPSDIILNRGSRDGAQVGNAVIFQDNFIGVIDTVTDHFCKVVLVTKNGVSLIAKDSDTTALGVIKGMGSSLVLDNVVLSDSLHVGDTVVTGGTLPVSGSGYPEGLVIGKIISIDRDPSALFQKASIQSLFKIEKLQTVFILTN